MQNQTICHLATQVFPRLVQVRVLATSFHAFIVLFTFDVIGPPFICNCFVFGNRLTGQK